MSGKTAFVAVTILTETTCSPDKTPYFSGARTSIRRSFGRCRKNCSWPNAQALDAARVKYQDEIAAARASVLTVEGQTVRIGTKAMSFDDFIEVADYTVIEDAYRRAGRVIYNDKNL